MARAALAQRLRARDRVEGGSTITQQVAKLLLDRRAVAGDRSAARSRLAAEGSTKRSSRCGSSIGCTKPEILALYLNLAPYGNQITGAERASHAYFGMPASTATPAQAAFLAALPQRPSRFNPWRNLRAGDRSPASRSSTAWSAADSSRRRLRPRRARSVCASRRDVAVPRAALRRDGARGPAGSEAGARVVTTLDAELQRTVEGIVRSQRSRAGASRRHQRRGRRARQRDGEWLAWEGSGNFETASTAARSTVPTVPRQPGSALKPFTYALAFESGRTPATVLPDMPSSFPTAEDGVVYTPRNYDGRFRGPLLARAALAGSITCPRCALASELGVPDVLRFLRRAGFTTFDQAPPRTTASASRSATPRSASTS